MSRRTGLSCAYDRVPSEFLTEIINLKDGSGKVREKKNIKRSNCLPRKGADTTNGQPRETSWHNTKQETIEPGQLRAISSTAEIIKEKRSSEVYAQCTCCSKRSRWWTDFCRCGKSLADGQPYKKRTLKLQMRTAANSFQPSDNFELPNKSNEANAMAHQKIQIYWTLMRDLFRRCTKSPTQSPNNRSVSKA